MFRIKQIAKYMKNVEKNTSIFQTLYDIGS